MSKHVTHITANEKPANNYKEDTNAMEKNKLFSEQEKIKMYENHFKNIMALYEEYYRADLSAKTKEGIRKSKERKAALMKEALEENESLNF